MAAAVGAGIFAFSAVRRRASRMEVDGRVALITGGSRGLGLAIARELGSLGARVIIAARDADELERARQDLESRGVHVSVIPRDLTNRDEARSLVEDAVALYGRLDILINNAGIIQVGPVQHMEIADFESAMDLHFWAPLETIRTALPVMRRQGGGRIVNVSSIGGKIGVAHLVPYCASKFALTGLSSGLRAELARDGIVVTTVIPGLMRTGSPFNAWFKGRHRDEFAWFTVADSLPAISIDAARAARQIVAASRAGDAELVVGWPAKLAVVANAIAPEAIAQAIALTNRLLPGSTGASGDRARSGWQSLSSWAPSRLTRLTERAAVDHNQVETTPLPSNP
jgi:NAD(P)-dependent dehydrogenase (short-subunit alcohol dehydrogenase family)